MTNEESIGLLKRTPFNELGNDITYDDSYYETIIDRVGIYNEQLEDPEHLRKHGWTKEEYNKEKYRMIDELFKRI